MTDLSPLWISLKTATLATAFAATGGIVAARVLRQFSTRWRFICEILVLIPLVLPPTVLGYALIVLLGPHGFIGGLCLLAFDTTLIFTWWAGVIAATIVAFPVVYLSARAAFQQVDQHLLEAARVFGASAHRRFFDILLPLARPGLLAGLLLSLVRALGEFGATLMVAGHISGETETIPMRIFFAFEAGDDSAALLWSLTALSLATLALGLVQILSRQQNLAK